MPLQDFAQYKERMWPMTSPVRLSGRLSRSYESPAPQPAGSRFYPIGGTLNNVHIRREVDFKMQEDREQKSETAIALVGRLTPAMSNQRVRIDLFDPNGAPRVAQVQTDTQGRFRAVFDLRWAPTLEANRKKWKRARRIVSGSYRARARVWAASEATSDVTPWVYVTR